MIGFADAAAAGAPALGQVVQATAVMRATGELDEASTLLILKHGGRPLLRLADVARELPAGPAWAAAWRGLLRQQAEEWGGAPLITVEEVSKAPAQPGGCASAARQHAACSGRPRSEAAAAQTCTP